MSKHTTSDAARQGWTGYGPRVDPEQWRMAAEWLQCIVLHGGLDEIEAEAERIGLGFTPALVMVEACVEALHRAAGEVEAGRVREACCPDRQRHNRAVACRPAAAPEVSTTGVVPVAAAHDDTTGDTVPLPVGTVVAYTGSYPVSEERWWVARHEPPMQQLTWTASDYRTHYPDGVAYVLLPEGVEDTPVASQRALRNTRRGSLRPVADGTASGSV